MEHVGDDYPCTYAGRLNGGNRPYVQDKGLMVDTEGGSNSTSTSRYYQVDAICNTESVSSMAYLST